MSPALPGSSTAFLHFRPGRLQIESGVLIFGLQLHRSFEVRNRFRQFARHLREHDSQIVVRLGIVRLEAQALLKLRNRFAGAFRLG